MKRQVPVSRQAQIAHTRHELSIPLAFCVSLPKKSFLFQGCAQFFIHLSSVFMQKLGGNSKTPPAAIAFIVRLSEFLRELT